MRWLIWLRYLLLSLSSPPETHNVDERTNSGRLSSDFLTCAVVHTHIFHPYPISLSQLTNIIKSIFKRG